MQSTDLGVKIGSRIRASRMSIGLTQEQLAEKVGVSWSTISSLERGMHMVSLERLLDICEALNSGLEIILCDYINIAGLYSDNDSQKILEMLTLLTPTQKKVSAKYCYAAHESRLHQNDRCKRFLLF